MIQYEHNPYVQTSPEDELMHYGKKGMKWRVRRKKKLKNGRPKDLYTWGSRDKAKYNKMSKAYGHQEWTARMNQVNANLRKRWDYGR